MGQSTETNLFKEAVKVPQKAVVTKQDVTVEDYEEDTPKPLKPSGDSSIPAKLEIAPLIRHLAQKSVGGNVPDKK